MTITTHMIPHQPILVLRTVLFIIATLSPLSVRGASAHDHLHHDDEIPAIDIQGGPNGTIHHRCIHDSAEMQSIFKRDFHIVEQRYPIAERAFGQQATGNLRFVFSTLDLEDSTKYCTSASQTVSDFQGGTIGCSASTVFDATKKSILVDKVLPAAALLLSKALQVTNVEGNLNVGNGCSNFNVPATHTNDGVPNADFVLYVAAAPTQPNVVAWASTCAADSNGRPTTGKANFSPAYLTWGSDTKANNRLVRTAVHEILHALGFSAGFWTQNGQRFSKTFTVTETRRGRAKTVMVSPNVVSAAQSHFGCSTLTGPEIEDEGGSGTAGSHWERRTHYDDVMSGVTGDSMMLSPLTLALLEDLGIYTIDYSNAEAPLWGSNAGCGIHTNNCNEALGGSGSLFCSPSANSLPCTYDYLSVGVCGYSTTLSGIPLEEQYFGNAATGGTASLMNYCPVVQGYTNRQCDNYLNSLANDTIGGYYYGSDGMCFVTSTNVLQQGYTSSDLSPGRCLRTLCQQGPSGGLVVQFQVGTSGWIPCPSAGTVISLAAYGYQGTVTCPSVATHCTSKTTPADNVTATMGPTTSSLPTTIDPNATVITDSTTQAATTTTTTASTTPTLTVSPNLPSGPNPVAVRPVGPVLAFAELSIVGDTVTAMLNSVDTLLPAVTADVAAQLGLNESGAGVTVNRYAAAVVWIAGVQYPAISLQLLLSTPSRSSGFLLQMWQYSLNQTAPLVAATWMSATQELYAQSSSGTPFSVTGVKVSAPVKSSEFLTQCGSVGCILTVAVGTIGGWAALVLVAMAVYQFGCRRASPEEFAVEPTKQVANEPHY